MHLVGKELHGRLTANHCLPPSATRRFPEQTDVPTTVPAIVVIHTLPCAWGITPPEEEASTKTMPSAAPGQRLRGTTCAEQGPVFLALVTSMERIMLVPRVRFAVLTASTIAIGTMQL